MKDKRFIYGRELLIDNGDGYGWRFFQFETDLQTILKAQREYESKYPTHRTRLEGNRRPDPKYKLPITNRITSSGEYLLNHKRISYGLRQRLREAILLHNHRLKKRTPFKLSPPAA